MLIRIRIPDIGGEIFSDRGFVVAFGFFLSRGCGRKNNPSHFIHIQKGFQLFRGEVCGRLSFTGKV